MYKQFALLLTASLVTISGGLARADVTLPSIIGDGMVLQRDMPAPIWGWADAGEKVTVSFAGQTKSVNADDNGKWMVELDAMKANTSEQTLTVKGNNTVTLGEVMVGEVWICSGQSNMESRVGN